MGRRSGRRVLAVLSVGIVSLAPFVVPQRALAHRDGCHRWHSCPSDSGGYECGDAGYACRYPTYDESQKGSIPDPSYDDYGFTDYGDPDYDYGYSDECPLGGCDGDSDEISPAVTAPDTSLDLDLGRLPSPAADLDPTSATSETRTFAQQYGAWIFWGGVVAVTLMYQARKARPSVAPAAAYGAKPRLSPKPAPRTRPSTRKRSGQGSAGSRSAASPGNRCRCGGRFVVRTRRADGKKFLGCSGFPRCRNTRDLG
ncbi:MAG: topoisomerase DNA-binding C4 zinc finger domain-containing protein [Actinobacteria bacterium]|nr:topoisomerase DNA-binding C4 zinc finger domain-containing protein [Actinomycetota bacterium]